MALERRYCIVPDVEGKMPLTSWADCLDAMHSQGAPRVMSGATERKADRICAFVSNEVVIMLRATHFRLDHLQVDIFRPLNSRHMRILRVSVLERSAGLVYVNMW